MRAILPHWVDETCVSPPPSQTRMEMTQEYRVTGTIIKTSRAGWGFISSKEIKFTRIFFHWTELVQDTMRFPELKLGMTVEFVPIEVPGRGWRAINVRVIEKRRREETDEPISQGLAE